MSGCGCSKQNGGGFKRCSCKKCRRYSQRGGGLFGDFFGSEKPKDEGDNNNKTQKPLNEEKKCIPEHVYNDLLNKYNELLANSTQIDKLPSEGTPTPPLPLQEDLSRGGGGGGNMMARSNFGLHGGYGELVTAQDEATIGLYSGPSMATQGIATQQGGKRRTRKIRKTRRMKKSRKYRR